MMNIRRNRKVKITGPVWITLLITLLGVWVSPAYATELDEILAQLKTTAGTTETLLSDFVQEKNLSIMAETLVSQGRFAYQKPDQLRWELLQPIASGFVLRGRQGDRWNSLSRKVEAYAIDRDPVMGMVAKQLLAWARVDLDWLESHYRMALKSEQPLCLLLTPRDQGEAGFIDHLEVTFASDLNYVEQVLLAERSGDSTLLKFVNVALNGTLSPAIFEPPVF